MNEWKSAGGRITLFPAQQSSPPPLSALELYKQVWGEDPDNFQKQANPLVPTTANGKRGSLMAGSMAHPTRIDLTLTPLAGQEAQGSFPLIEDTGELHTELLKIVDLIDQRIISQPIVRVAFSVVFQALKPNPTEANRALTAVIPTKYGIRLSDEEDFIFQINRPYPSRKVNGVRMNSLVKWSMDRLQILTISIPAGGSPTPIQISSSTRPPTETFIAASVHFDINSVPTESALPDGQLSPLLHEALIEAAQMQQALGLKIEGFENAKQSH
jgi:hypothetical protein